MRYNITLPNGIIKEVEESDDTYLNMLKKKGYGVEPVAIHNVCTACES